jgi:hypothetical protein
MVFSLYVGLVRRCWFGRRFERLFPGRFESPRWFLACDVRRIAPDKTSTDGRENCSKFF